MYHPVSLLLAGVLLTAAVGAQAYETIEVKDGGTIVGEVRFVGDIPSVPPLRVPKDADICGSSVPSEALLVSPKNRGVRNTVVYLEGIERGKELNPSSALLDNLKCLMRPHVQIIARGSDMDIHNADPLLHNVHGVMEGGRTIFNLGLAIQGQTVRQRIRKSGIATVTCDSHPHMRSYVIVMEHPYFSVTDDAGRFRMADVPPGNYRLNAWHESWRIDSKDTEGKPHYGEPTLLTQEVLVSPGGDTRVQFELR